MNITSVQRLICLLVIRGDGVQQVLIRQECLQIMDSVVQNVQWKVILWIN